MIECRLVYADGYIEAFRTPSFISTIRKPRYVVPSVRALEAACSLDAPAFDTIDFRFTGNYADVMVYREVVAPTLRDDDFGRIPGWLHEELRRMVAGSAMQLDRQMRGLALDDIAIDEAPPQPALPPQPIEERLTHVPADLREMVMRGGVDEDAL